MNNTTKNLFFLLGAAPMGMGGCVVDLDPFDTSLTTLNNTTETSGDGDGDQTGDGDGDQTGDGDGDQTGDGDGDQTGDGDGEPGDGDGDGDGEPGDGDGDAGSPCAAYAEFYGSCYGPRTIPETEAYCEMALMQVEMYYGIECRAAFEDMYVCISGITCEDFMSDPPAGCESQAEAVQMACIP